jgi:hypothetical protein
MPTDTDFVIAASVNVLTLRAIASGLGAPGWTGAMVAAAAMAIAADDQVSPNFRKVAGLLSAPGAITVQLLTERKALNQEPCCAPCGAGEICDDSK